MPRTADIRIVVLAGIVGLVGALALMTLLSGPIDAERAGRLDPALQAQQPFAAGSSSVEDGTVTLAAAEAAAAPTPAPEPAPKPAREPDNAGQAAPAAAAESAAVDTVPDARRTSAGAVPASFTTVRITADTPITAQPGGGKVIGTLPARSRYLQEGTTAWVHEVTDDGQHGAVYVPWEQGRRSGWIDLQGTSTTTTDTQVRVSLSRLELQLVQGGEVQWTAPVTTGAPASPTPRGRYWVTDRVPIPGGGPFGTFAFGISGLQPNLPAGWTGGDQLAIHGTNAPATIGSAASAGCIRVSEETLTRLKPFLQLGTPVIFAQ